MPVEIVVPRLGWSMEEGAFSGWLKRSGDAVAAGDPLFALESDKVTMDVESLDGGILFVPPDAPETGAMVRVGQLLGYLLAPGEPVPVAGTLPAQETAPAILPAAAVQPAVGQAILPAAGFQPVPSGPQPSRRAPITPRARRVAAELAVDIAALKGTGLNGRIREADVRAASPARSIPTTNLRRTIAARMLESHRNTAPVTLTTRAGASALVALRNRSQPAPSYTDIVAKLTALALAGHPALAGRWENGRIVLPSQIDIGIAVDTPRGLLAPVLRNVAATGLPDLALRARELIQAAHDGRLRAEDLTGGVFTITNLGAYGIDAFTPIVNYPETAVLGLGAIRREPVVTESGGIAARDLITLSLTFDHRVVDGAPAARFLQTLVGLIEAPPAI